MSIFLTNKEINLINSINEELIEDIIAHSIRLFKINPEFTNSENIYGESSNKTFQPGLEFNALVNYLEPEITTTNVGGVGQNRKIEVYTHRKHLVDKSAVIEEGDYLYFDEQYFEITKVTEPQHIQGLPEYSHEIKIEAIGAGVSQITIQERKS